jgi:hypothetical protein
MLKLRGKPERKPKNEPQPFCGLISCASCGMMITGEHKGQTAEKWKCSRVYILSVYKEKKMASNVLNLPFREEEMNRQLSSLITKSFFAQRLGGGTQSSCFARPWQIRPVFGCV